MATKKAGGSTRNMTNVQPKYLGIKLHAGETARVGSIIVRQRGTRYMSGTGTAMGKDHTIFAMTEGTVTYANKRKQNFDSTTSVHKIVKVTTGTKAPAKK